MTVSIPPPSERIVPRDTVMEPWYRDFESWAAAINDTITGLADTIADLATTTASIDGYIAAPVLPIYTVVTLPSAATVGRLIYVSNEAGGAVPAFSDGVNWRRVTDRAIVT